MPYLLITSSLSDDETVCFGPVRSAAETNRAKGYLAHIEDQFNIDKKLSGVSGVKLIVRPVAAEARPLITPGDLRALGTVVQALLHRQFRERYEEIQNV